VSQCGAGAPGDASSGRFVGPRVSSFSPILFCWVERVAGGEIDFVTLGATLSSWLAAHSCTDVASYPLSVGGGVRGYVDCLGTRARAAPRHPSCYFFKEALFVLVTHDDGVSLHLRNAGTTSACSSVGSFRLVRVSLVRFAPALYPIF